MGHVSLFDSVENILMTHSHEDHFSVDSLWNICYDGYKYRFSHISVENYVSSQIYNMLKQNER